MFDKPPRNNVNDNENITLNNNDNVTYKNINNNDIDNVVNSKRDSHLVDSIVARVMNKLHAAPDSHDWYCKVAWKLSQSQIELNLEQALKGNSPQKYFAWLSKRDMN